jgi:metal-responsive CopG/Arc/MetJ family transcriptional regulator
VARKPVLLQLSEELLERIDQLTATQGRSRSAVVREAVERYITEQSQALKDQQMAEGYRRIPDDEQFDEWAEVAVRELVEEEPW